MKEAAIKWYNREYWPYEIDRLMVAAYAEFFKSVEWQLFATFTFGSQHSDDQADWKFNQFINRLEATIKADVIYVRGDEKRFSGCGKPACGRHFHVLITSAAPLDPFMVECLWKNIAGHRHDGADVRLYDPELDGVQYVFKMMNQPYGEWKIRNLHLVLPMAQEMIRRRTRRQLKRHELRMKLLANAEPVKCTPNWRSSLQ